MNVYEEILTGKVLIEIGAMTLDEANEYFESLTDYITVESLLISLCPYPKDIKTLSHFIGDWLENNHFSISSERLEQAAVAAGDKLYAKYRKGTLSLKNTCFYLGRLLDYGCYSYVSASDSYDMYLDGMCCSIDDVRRELDNTFKIESKDISLSSITVIRDGVIYYRDKHGDELPLLNLKDCHENYKKHLALHQDEYSQFKENHRCVADCCYNNSYAFFLFYTPNKTYISIRTKPSVWHTFLNRIGWNWAAKQMNQFFTFQKKINAAGYSTYDLI